MPDREKVIKGLDICINTIRTSCQSGCPYYEQCTKGGIDNVFKPILRDALALLKGQEAVKPVKRIEENEWTVCGYCHEHLISKWMFCPNCGKAVKWNEVYR